MAGLAEDLSIESDDERVLVGHNGRWPNALNRAAILRLPAVQPEEVANGGFPIWRMPTPCPYLPLAEIESGHSQATRIFGSGRWLCSMDMFN